MPLIVNMHLNTASQDARAILHVDLNAVHRGDLQPMFFWYFQVLYKKMNFSKSFFWKNTGPFNYH